MVVALLNAVLAYFGLPMVHGALPHSPLHVRAMADVEDRVCQGHVYLKLESFIISSLKYIKLVSLFHDESGEERSIPSSLVSPLSLFSIFSLTLFFLSYPPFTFLFGLFPFFYLS